MKTMKTTASIKEAPVDKWLVRTSTSTPSVRKGITTTFVSHELVFGHTTDSGRVVGKSYHELCGPTALKSITEFAEYAKRLKIPPEKLPKGIADGGRVKNTSPDLIPGFTP